MSVSNHLTARLVLDLMNIAVDGETTASSPRNKTSTNTGNLDMRQRAQNLRYGIMAEASSSGPESSSCSERSFTTASSSAHNSNDSSSWTRDERMAEAGSSLASEQDDEEEEPPRSRCDASLFDDDFSDADGDDVDEADRSRAVATAGARQDSCASLPATTATANDNHRRAVTSNAVPSQTCQRDVQPPYHASNNLSSTLGEMNHRDLTGALAALHGFMPSGGDPAVLEKAYDLARDVAGSTNDVKVAFDACRLALAAGYVHSLQKSTPELAHEFALHHSLPRLAQSLKMYWSCQGEWSTLAQGLEWEECMLSLLEVTSSIYLMTEVEDIVSILDAEVDAGVAESMGRYCVLNSEVLSEYPHVGNVCAQRHLRASDISRNHHQRELSVHTE